MKVLGHFAFFLLPDDFDGGLSDALRLLADYHEGEGASRREIQEMPEGHAESRRRLFADFLKELKNDRKHVGDMGIRQYLKGEWTRLGPEGDW